MPMVNVHTSALALGRAGEIPSTLPQDIGPRQCWPRPMKYVNEPNGFSALALLREFA